MPQKLLNGRASGQAPRISDDQHAANRLSSQTPPTYWRRVGKALLVMRSGAKNLSSSCWSTLREHGKKFSFDRQKKNRRVFREHNRKVTMDDMKISSPKKPAVNKFERAEHKGVSVSAEALIHAECLQPGKTLPLLVQPALDGIDLIAWATNNREFIETHH